MWGAWASTNGAAQVGHALSVNIVIFDKNYNFLDAAFSQISTSAQQVGVSPVVPHDYLTKEYTIKEGGYAFLYIVNENATQVDAYFDDVKMTYTPGNVIQSSEYYPFGMQTASSWTRDNVTGNNFLGNGGTELNTTSQVYDLDYRNYDPILGRMNQVDPLADSYSSTSPYHYAGNNPININDPTGAEYAGTGSPGPSHWSRDMEEMSGGNKPAKGMGVLSAYQDGSDMWGMVGHYNLDANMFGYGGYYSSYSNGGGVAQAADFLLNKTSHGGTWSNGITKVYSDQEYYARMGQYNRAYVAATATATCSTCPRGDRYKDYVNDQNNDWTYYAEGIVAITGVEVVVSSGGSLSIGDATDYLGYAGYAGNVADYARYEMIVARTGRDVLSNVGRSGNLKTIYWLGQGGKYLGKAGTAGAVLSIAVDVKSVKDGNLSLSRFSYNTTGTVSSIAVGAVFGGLPGAVVGLGFKAGQMAYDGLMWFGDQLSQAAVQTENAFKNGWIPGH